MLLHARGVRRAAGPKGTKIAPFGVIFGSNAYMWPDPVTYCTRHTHTITHSKDGVVRAVSMGSS